MSGNPQDRKVSISVEATDAENDDQQSNSGDYEGRADVVVSPSNTFPPVEESTEDSLNERRAEDPNAVKFQLIPISEVAGRNAVGEVVERVLKDGEVMKLGRLIVRDGQTTIKGKKPATEIDTWFTSKVVSRLHAEIWSKEGQLVLKDVGSSSGTFLNKTRLSPNGKESGPYPLKQGDIIQFGVDFKGKNDNDDNYRAVTMKIGFFDQSWLKQQKSGANPQKFTDGLKQMLAASNPYGMNSSELTGEDVDCCICISNITPFQALFMAPCSHVFHFKCVGTIIYKSPMFQCPLCRQVANLTASVSCESLDETVPKYTTPLPMLESEVPYTAPPIEVPAPRPEPRQSRNSRNTRRHSLKMEGKKLLENLGIIKNKQQQQPNTTPSANSPPVLTSAEQLSDLDKKQKKRAFSFKSKKDKDKKDVPRSADNNGESSAAGARNNNAQDSSPKPTPASGSAKQAR